MQITIEVGEGIEIRPLFHIEEVSPESFDKSYCAALSIVARLYYLYSGNAPGVDLPTIRHIRTLTGLDSKNSEELLLFATGRGERPSWFKL